MTLAWHFEDEQSDFTAAVLRRLRGDRALVPSLWAFEVANGLEVALRRRRITKVELVQAVERTLSLPIDVQEIALNGVLGPVAELARQQTLTVYDASYLHLALRERLPLATLDGDLIASAKRVGLPELDLGSS